MPLQKLPPLLTDLVWTEPAGLARQLVEIANEGEPTAAAWIGRLIDEGVSPKLLRDITGAVRHMKLEASPVYDLDSGKFQWRYSWASYRDTTEISALENGVCAMVTIEIVNADLRDWLHRCEECSKFYFGDPRSRWCSNTCGSRHRVREKRKRDRR